MFELTDNYKIDERISKLKEEESLYIKKNWKYSPIDLLNCIIILST